MQVGEGPGRAQLLSRRKGETGSLSGLSVTVVGDLSQNLRAPAQENATDCKVCIRSATPEHPQSSKWNWWTERQLATRSSLSGRGKPDVFQIRYTASLLSVGHVNGCLNPNSRLRLGARQATLTQSSPTFQRCFRP